MKCARVTKNLVKVAHNNIFESVYDILYLYAYKTPGHVLVCLEYFFFTLEEAKSSYLVRARTFTSVYTIQYRYGLVRLLTQPART